MFSKALAKPLVLTFPDTSLLVKVVRNSERKIDERLRASTGHIARKSMTSNEMELHASLAECGVPPTIDGVFAFEAALTISSNLLNTWWLETELNRRRQPFRCYVMLCFKQLK